MSNGQGVQHQTFRPPGYPIMSNGQGVQHQTFRPPGYGLSQTINMQNPNNHQLHRMPPPTMETATKYCQPIPPTFVSFQPTEPFRACSWSTLVTLGCVSVPF
jgi:hypothetical protein